MFDETLSAYALRNYLGTQGSRSAATLGYDRKALRANGGHPNHNDHPKADKPFR